MDFENRTVLKTKEIDLLPLPLVSVIVPVYKTEKYLDRCVSSLLVQTEKNIEIILVEDGSPDNCPTMCDEWAERDSRIRVVHQKNSGLSTARNVGIELSHAPYIMFCDSDDEVSPDFCRIPIEQMRIHDAEIAVFDFDMTDEDGNILKNQKFRMTVEGVMNRDEALCRMASQDIYEFAWNKCYRREMFCNVRYPDGQTWEDMVTTYPLFAAAQRVVVMKDVLYYYRQRPDSLIHENPSTAIDAIVERRDMMCRYLHKICPSAETYMQMLAAKEEIKFLCIKWKERNNRVRYEAVRDRLLVRPIKLAELTVIERSIYRLAPLIPNLFGVIVSGLLYLRTWKNRLKTWWYTRNER